MELKYEDIVCDTCGHYIKTNFEKYPEFLNKPCPKCGYDLLTRKDYNNCLRNIKIINYVNNSYKYFFKWINPFFYIGLVIPLFKSDFNKTTNIYRDKDGKFKIE